MFVWDLSGVIWRSLLLAVSLANSKVDPRPYRGAPKAHRNSIRPTPKEIGPSLSPETHSRESDPHSVPYPPRTTVHTEVCRQHNRAGLRDPPLDATRNRGGLTVGSALRSAMALLCARVGRADYGVTLI